MYFKVYLWQHDNIDEQTVRYGIESSQMKLYFKAIVPFLAGEILNLNNSNES